MTDTKVSVIVPVYNAERYLSDCIDSIASQTHRNIEIILVDDGSTDSSGKICDTYASDDHRIKVIHKANGGVSAARNTGVNEATGEYIMMVDADDIVHPEIVSKLLEIIHDTGAKASMCRYTTKSLDAITPHGTVRSANIEEIIERTLYQSDFDTSLCAKLLPADAVKAEPEPTGCRYEDLDTFYRIYEKIGGRIAYTSAPMYYYRDHKDSFINNFTPDRLDVLDVTERIVRHYSGNKDLLEAARDRRFSACFNMYVLTKRTGQYDKESARCWDMIKTYRLKALINPKVRIKNKIGALLSYFGQSAVMLASRIIYK